jgi:hypothetical protein
MANHAGDLQSRFFPAKLEAEGDDAIFNTLLMEEGAEFHVWYLYHIPRVLQPLSLTANSSMKRKSRPVYLSL